MERGAVLNSQGRRIAVDIKQGATMLRSPYSANISKELQEPEQELTDWEAGRRESNQTKVVFRRGGGVLRNGGGGLPFLPSLHLRPDVSDVRAAHAAVATRGYNHQHFFLIFVL